MVSFRMLYCNIRHIPLVLFTFLSLIYASDDIPNTSKKTDVISLDQLPEPFTDHQLPSGRQSEADICFDLMGCISKLTKAEHPTNPNTYKTEFQIHHRQTVDFEDSILFERVENCLVDKSDNLTEKNGPKKCIEYPFDLEQLRKSGWDPQRRTIILISGYMAIPNNGRQRRAKNAWLKLADVNVIFVSWPGGNHGLYDTAVANTKAVARQVTVLLYYLASIHGYSLKDELMQHNLNLVGHSLGAHIAGFVGQDFSGKIGRITGLDPAGPNFHEFDSIDKLDRSDAMLVEVFHTNGGTGQLWSGQFGDEAPLGHLDFYANDGVRQPNCQSPLDIRCNHLSVHDFYLELVQHHVDINQLVGDSAKVSRHRIWAFRSDSYQDFHSASSMIGRCPNTILQDNDLTWSDMNNCMLPIDIESDYDAYMNELETIFGIRFNQNQTVRLFFHTNPSKPYLGSTNLVRIRLSKHKKNQSQKKGKQGSEADIRTPECDIKVEFTMADSSLGEREVKGFRLVDQVEYFEAILTYPVQHSESALSLAEIDRDDFHLENSDRKRLLEKLQNNLPIAMKISGLSQKKEKKDNTLVNFFKSIFVGSKKKEDKLHECSLDVQTITIQPLVKLHRHLIATYSVVEPSDVDIRVLKEEEMTSKDVFVSGNSDGTKKRNVEGVANINSVIHLDTIILGPYDECSKYDQPKKMKRSSFRSNRQNPSPESTMEELELDSNDLLIFIIVVILLGIIVISVWIGPKTSPNVGEVYRR